MSWAFPNHEESEGIILWTQDTENVEELASSHQNWSHIFALSSIKNDLQRLSHQTTKMQYRTGSRTNFEFKMVTRKPSIPCKMARTAIRRSYLGSSTKVKSMLHSFHETHRRLPTIRILGSLQRYRKGVILGGGNDILHLHQYDNMTCLITFFQFVTISLYGLPRL